MTRGKLLKRCFLVYNKENIIVRRLQLGIIKKGKVNHAQPNDRNY